MDEVNSASQGFCPYVGLQPYREADHHYFFGRQRDSRLIASNLYASHLTILYGPSGVGKSSILRAGVIPRLRASPRTAVVIFDTWSEKDLLSAIKTRCLEALAAVQGIKDIQPDPALPLDEFLYFITRKLGCTLAIIFDQFEEYFLYHPEKDDVFDAEFAPAVNREEIDANFLIALREDALSRLDRFYTRIPNMLGNTLRLRHLDARSACDAIVKPLEVYSKFHPDHPPFTVEDALVDQLIDEVQVEKLTIGQGGRGKYEGSEITSDSEIRIETPFLQLVLTRLWEEEIAQGSTVLRLETLQALGGAVRIVRTHMDAAMNTLSQKEQETAASIFRYMVTPSGTKIAYSISDLEYYAGPGQSLESVLEKLARGNVRIMRAVASPGKQGTVQYEIYHDVLAQAVLDWRARYESRKQLLDFFFALNEKSDMDSALQTYRDVVQRAPQQAFFPERYEVQRIIGRGELGVIFLLFDSEENSQVTATILESTYIFTAEDLDQFTRQMSVLSSPRIGSIKGFKQHRGQTYMLSEYIEGQTLLARLMSKTSLKYTEAMQIAKEVAEALKEGHEKGLTHLSLRPASILLTPNGVKLVNYGIGQLTTMNRNPNQPAKRYNDPYLAPEQNYRQAGDERSDIYALGTILYEMLTGRIPSTQNLLYEMLMGRTPSTETFTYASEVNFEATEAVDRLINRARELDPPKRFASAEDMAREIVRISTGSFSKANRQIQIVLAWVSQYYEKLSTGRIRTYFLIGLLFLLIISQIPTLPVVLISPVRMLLALLLNSFVISNLCHWAIRASTKRSKTKPLSNYGRGIGALLGFIFTINLIAIVGVLELGRTIYILSIYMGMLSVCIVETVIAIGIMVVAAWTTDLLIKDYTTGFYWCFVLILILELILTILGLPAGLISIY